MVVTKQMVRGQLAKSNRLVVKSLLRLTNRQEAVEKARRSSLFINKRGFRKQHGCLVVYAEKVWAGQWLSSEEIEFLRPRLMIYAGQIAEMMNARQLPLFD
jgi:sialic acid synthase SpsE